MNSERENKTCNFTARLPGGGWGRCNHRWPQTTSCQTDRTQTNRARSLSHPPTIHRAPFRVLGRLLQHFAFKREKKTKTRLEFIKDLIALRRECVFFLFPCLWKRSSDQRTRKLPNTWFYFFQVYDLEAGAPFSNQSRRFSSGSALPLRPVPCKTHQSDPPDLHQMRLRSVSW